MVHSRQTSSRIEENLTWRVLEAHAERLVSTVRKREDDDEVEQIQEIGTHLILAVADL
jgi:hypothetical protein